MRITQFFSHVSSNSECTSTRRPPLLLSSSTMARISRSRSAACGSRGASRGFLDRTLSGCLDDVVVTIFPLMLLLLVGVLSTPTTLRRRRRHRHELPRLGDHPPAACCRRKEEEGEAIIVCISLLLSTFSLQYVVKKALFFSPKRFLFSFM